MVGDRFLVIYVAIGLLAGEEQLGGEVGHGRLHSGSLQNQKEQNKTLYKISTEIHADGS